MIDIQRDELLSLSQLARRLPSTATSGGKVNPATVFRWVKSGLRGHRLEVIHIGGRMLTTWAAYLEFSKSIAAGSAPAPAPTPSRGAVKRIRDARQILADAGIA